MQDAFERAMREPAFFERIAEPRGWLRVAVVRLAVSRLRRRAVWERIVPLVPRPSDGVPDPDLHRALRRLPATQRGAVVLRYWFGSDYAEIARALGLAEASVGATLTRARAALRKELS